MSVLSVTFRRWMFVVLSLAASGAACRSPASPTPENVAPETALVAFVIQGRVLDGDSGAPVAGALVSTLTVGVGSSYTTVQPVSTATADADGGFVLTANLPTNWVDLFLHAAAAGYERGTEVWIPRTTDSAILTLEPTVALLPGKSLETQLRPTAFCGDNGEPCRRIVVESAAPVEVELIPRGSQQNVGLSLTGSYYGMTTYQRRATVSNGEVWIVGEVGPVTLKARKP